jgi:hypothetical protein
MQRGKFGLTAEERRAYDNDGFFVRERAIHEEELEALRDAAECATALAASGIPTGDDYLIDGNRMFKVEAEREAGIDTA